MPPIYTARYFARGTRNLPYPVADTMSALLSSQQMSDVRGDDRYVQYCPHSLKTVDIPALRLQGSTLTRTREVRPRMPDSPSILTEHCNFTSDCVSKIRNEATSTRLHNTINVPLYQVAMRAFCLIEIDTCT